VLHVYGGDDRNASLEQIQDVFVAFLVFRAGSVGVGQLVDDRDRGAPGYYGVDIHLFEGDAAVFYPPEWNSLEVSNQRRGLCPPMGLDVGNDDIDALPLELVSVLQHFIGLPYPRSGPNVDT
jgi:hypothetical protein